MKTVTISDTEYTDAPDSFTIVILHFFVLSISFNRRIVSFEAVPLPTTIVSISYFSIIFLIKTDASFYLCR